MNEIPNMRHQASQCVSRARTLLAQRDELAAREAALELRLAIEYITYDQLQAYLKEVPNDALKKWTPKQVISEMLEVDPHADQSSTIAVGTEHEYGIAPPPEEMHSLGEDRRFSLKWANKNHNALGNFLHAPTMYQIETANVPTADTMIAKAMAIADECEKILASPVWNVNFGQFLEFDCGECGTHIPRRVGSFTEETGVVCPNSKCRATYDATPIEDDKVRFSLREATYTCRGCGAKNEVGRHRIRDGEVLECQCGKKARIVQQFGLLPIEEQVAPAAGGQDTSPAS